MISRFELLITRLSDGSKTKFSSLIGKSKSTVSFLVSGTQTPTFDVLLRLAKLGVNIDWLIMGRGQPFVENSTVYH